MVGTGCAEEGAGAGGGEGVGVGCLELEGAGSLGDGAGVLEEERATEIIVGVSAPSSSALPTLAMRTFKGSARKTPGEIFGACDLAGMVLEMLEVLMRTMLLVLMLAILVGLSTLALSRAWAAGRSKETSRIRRWRSILRFGLRGHYLSASCERAPLRVLSSRCPIYEHTSLFVQAAASHVIGVVQQMQRSPDRVVVGRRGEFIHFVVSRTSRARITSRNGSMLGWDILVCRYDVTLS